MSVTLEQLQNAPVGSKLTGTGFAECTIQPDKQFGNYLYLKTVDGHSTSDYLYGYVSTAIIANPNVELVTPTPEIPGWKVIYSDKNNVTVNFTAECWKALQALLESMDKYESYEWACEMMDAYTAYREAERPKP